MPKPLVDGNPTRRQTLALVKPPRACVLNRRGQPQPLWQPVFCKVQKLPADAATLHGGRNEQLLQFVVMESQEPDGVRDRYRHKNQPSARDFASKAFPQEIL